MENLIAIAGLLLSGTWKFFTSINFPGTSMSFAVIICGAALVAFSIRLIKIILSASGGSLKSEKE